MGVALLVVGAVLLGAAGWIVLRDDGTSEDPGPLSEAVAAARPATDPFPQLTETTVRVGETSMNVVIADDVDERGQGLRERETIGGYDGMLFVYAEDSTNTFTMSTVPVPLDIAFYDADGRVVDRLRMEPCDGTDAGCPSYQSSAPFRYALETLAGDLPDGQLSS